MRMRRRLPRPAAGPGPAAAQMAAEIGRVLHHRRCRHSPPPPPSLPPVVGTAAADRRADEARDVDPGDALDDRRRLGDGPRPVPDELRRAVGREHGQVLDVGHRLGRGPDDLRQHREHRLDDGRLVELAVRLGPQLERLGLGLALREGDAGLGVALELGLLGLRLGVDEDDLGVRLALGHGHGRLGLAGQLDPLGFGLGLGDPGALLALGPPDLGLGIGLRGANGRGDQLLLLAIRLELGQLGLLAGDLLLRLRLGERACLGGAGLGGGDLHLGLGPADRDVAIGVDLDLVRLRLANGGLLVRAGLRHPGVSLPAGRLLLADQVHVAGLVADRLDRERVDLEPGRGEVALGGVLDGLLELHSIEVQLLDRERADDRPERTLEDVLDDRVDLLLLGVEEALGGVSDRLVVGADLERCNALNCDLDALARDSVREAHVDLSSGELQLADLVEQRQDDDALASDDLEARVAATERRRPAATGSALRSHRRPCSGC